jgi:hypothetical protein
MLSIQRDSSKSQSASLVLQPPANNIFFFQNKSAIAYQTPASSIFSHSKPASANHLPAKQKGYVLPCSQGFPICEIETVSIF